MKFQHPITPADISEPILSLCHEIVPNSAPEYVDVLPLLGAPANECFVLVEDQARNAGGESVIGWALWELPGLFIEAEFHAVWRNPDGEMVDISPKTRQTQRILFLPDPSARYDGRQVNNLRHAISRDPDVSAYLQAFDDEFEFLNRGERALQHGELRLNDRDAIEYGNIERRLETLHMRLLPRFPSFGPYTACWCGSGKKLKWCHKSV